MNMAEKHTVDNGHIAEQNYSNVIAMVIICYSQLRVLFTIKVDHLKIVLMSAAAI
jgi:hypothetical protein